VILLVNVVSFSDGSFSGSSVSGKRETLKLRMAAKDRDQDDEDVTYAIACGADSSEKKKEEGLHCCETRIYATLLALHIVEEREKCQALLLVKRGEQCTRQRQRTCVLLFGEWMLSCGESNSSRQSLFWLFRMLKRFQTSMRGSRRKKGQAFPTGAK
jgi:hypothetical protein